jgi:ribosome modulation factor
MNKQDIAEQAYLKGYKDGIKKLEKAIKSFSKAETFSTIYGAFKVFNINEDASSTLCNNLLGGKNGE